MLSRAAWRVWVDAGYRVMVMALVVVGVVIAGCGGDDRPSSSTAPQRSAPAPLSSRVALSGTVPRVRPRDLRAPISAYRRHVRRSLRAMLGDVAAIGAAARARDREGARAAWLRADERYEEIGAAYGAFGALDAAINGRDGALHRVERALWAGWLDAAARAMPQLAAAVRRLHARVKTMDIDPLEYTLRAHEVLEDTLHLRLTGQTSPWSGSAPTALRGNVRGTRVVLASVRALLDRRNPAVLDGADRALDRLEAALDGERAHGGALPTWDRLPLRTRERLAGLTAAAAERLAYVPDVLDPRPPRQPQAAFGQGAGR